MSHCQMWLHSVTLSCSCWSYRGTATRAPHSTSVIAVGGLFSSAAAFGQSAAATGSLFGGPAQSPAASGGFFGGIQPAGGNSFGTPPSAASSGQQSLQHAPHRLQLLMFVCRSVEQCEYPA